MKQGGDLDAWNELALEIIFRVLLRLKVGMEERQRLHSCKSTPDP